jgi:multiple sugar transport system permease protein
MTTSSIDVGQVRIRPRANNSKPLWRRIVKHAVLVLGAVLMIYPLLWMFGSSFKPESQILGTANPFPGKGASLKGYISGWSALGYPFWRYFLNSFVICALCIVGNLLSCSLAAFAFARLEFRFKGKMFAIMMGTIILPFHVLVVPQFVLFRTMGMVDTILPLVVPKFLAVDAFFIFLMIQFMRNVPRELDEAAALDGCGPLGLYWRIMMPLCLPALATTAIFTFIFTYNDFFSQLLYLSDTSKFTVPLALRSFIDNTATSNYAGLLAMSTLALLPVIGFFLVFQKLLVEGIATTGIK